MLNNRRLSQATRRMYFIQLIFSKTEGVNSVASHEFQCIVDLSAPDSGITVFRHAEDNDVVIPIGVGLDV